MKCLWAVLAVAVVVMGCGPKTKLIRGEWMLDGNPTPIKFEFKDNGQYVASWQGNGIDIKQHGEYGQNGTWLHMYVKRFETTSERLNKEYASTRLEPQRMRTKWQGEDVIVLDSGKGVRAMRRIKK